MKLRKKKRRSDDGKSYTYRKDGVAAGAMNVTQLLRWRDVVLVVVRSEGR